MNCIIYKKNLKTKKIEILYNHNIKINKILLKKKIKKI